MCFEKPKLAYCDGLILILLLFIPSILFSQKVENLRFEQSGKQIIIYYDLTGAQPGQTFDVQVFCSTDGGKTFGAALKQISGDAGSNITGGNGKKVVWNVLDERDRLEGEITFEVHINKILEPKVEDGTSDNDAEMEPLSVVEEMPSFPGGEAALLKYIIEHLKYPAAALENDIQGRVVVRFCVTSKGNVTQVSILKGVEPELDAEAIRVVTSLPQFKPGKQAGKPVPAWYTVPVSFTLK